MHGAEADEEEADARRAEVDEEEVDARRERWLSRSHTIVLSHDGWHDRVAQF
jgi:hypothetical protein